MDPIASLPLPALNSVLPTPYGLEIVDSCSGCNLRRAGHFCDFSHAALRSLESASYHSVMPSGALLFVKGQAARGVYIVCSGKVKLSTMSEEGKVLMIKQAEAGEILGLSAVLSCTNYEMTAETSSDCQLNFVGKTDLIALLNRSEVTMSVLRALSHDVQNTHRDAHDLLRSRSSLGKLAKLLLSSAPHPDSAGLRANSKMTHEEMAERIGACRETVSRLLSSLKRQNLIRIEEKHFVVCDRHGLEKLSIGRFNSLI